MNSDSKYNAIFCVTLGIGVFGTVMVGWPGMVAAALAITAIALAPARKGGE